MPPKAFLFPRPRPGLTAVLLAALLACGSAPAQARDESCKKDQDCAREALVHGEIRPLSAVLGVVREKVPGDIIEIELEREDGIWVYEVKVLPPSGRRKKLEIDARTLEILKIK